MWAHAFVQVKIDQAEKAADQMCTKIVIVPALVLLLQGVLTLRGVECIMESRLALEAKSIDLGSLNYLKVDNW